MIEKTLQVSSKEQQATSDGQGFYSHGCAFVRIGCGLVVDWVAWPRPCTGSAPAFPSGALPSGVAAGPMTIERICPPPHSKTKSVARNSHTLARTVLTHFCCSNFGGLLNSGFSLSILSSSVSHSRTGYLFVTDHSFHRSCYHFHVNQQNRQSCSFAVLLCLRSCVGGPGGHTLPSL